MEYALELLEKERFYCSAKLSGIPEAEKHCGYELTEVRKLYTKRLKDLKNAIAIIKHLS